MNDWVAACPACGATMGSLGEPLAGPPAEGPGDAAAGTPLDHVECPACSASYVQREGIWRFLPDDRAAYFAPFLADYHRIRRAEGRGSDDPDYYRRLPDVGPGDPLAWQWALRARTWRHLRRELSRWVGPGGRVVDLGAGVGWLSQRLAGLGYRPFAIDLSDDDLDGLGAARHYEPRWPRAQAELDRLPLADGQADLAIFNASFQYSTDYRATLAEALRVVRPGGAVLIVESPLYRDEAAGRRMVEERHADFEERFGTRSDAVPSREFLTEADLTQLADELDVHWQRSTPAYGWRWRLRPLQARLWGRRPPSRFELLAAQRVPGVPGRARFGRTWPQRLLLATGAAAALSSFTSAAAVGYLDGKVGQVRRVAVSAALHRVAAVTAPASGGADPASAALDGGGAVNILLVGVDSADGLAEGDRRRIDRPGGLRSDTVMLLRLEPSSGRAALLSFPRDLWLRLGGDGAFDRLNAALPLGGPSLLIQTIAAGFDVPIDHYAEVDFAQFRGLVDVIGGVPMPFATAVRDDYSGLYVGEPGCVLLDGDAALDFVRSRYLQYLDENGEWVADPYADLSRIQRQQDFLRRALKRARAKGLANPVTANRLVDAGLASVTVDDSFDVKSLASLAWTFRGLQPEDLMTYSMPVEVSETAGGLSIVEPLDQQAAPILDIFRGRDPDRPSSVQVTVVGAPLDLGAAGFVVQHPPEGNAATPAPAPTSTRIRYRFADRYKAELVESWLAGPVELEEVDELDGPGVEVDAAAGETVLAEGRPLPSRWLAASNPFKAVVPSEGAAQSC